MISRAARLPRICLACQSRLLQRSVVPNFRAISIRDGFRQRRLFASDSLSKDVDIDAIIAKKFAQANEKVENPKEDEINTSKLDDDEKDIRLSKTDLELIYEIDKYLFEERDSVDVAKHGDSSTHETDADSPESSAEPASKNPSSNTGFTFSDDALLETYPEDLARLLKSRAIRGNLLQNAPLGVSALGLEADAIILKNPNYIKRREEILEEPDQAPSKNRINDINWSRLRPEFLDKEFMASREEVWNNIEELRPDSKSLRLNDFNKLLHALYEGFTMAQLRDYVREAPTMPASSDNPLVDYPWVVKDIPWTPFTSITTDQLTSKTIDAYKVLTQKWNIQIQDHVEGVGQTFVWVDPHYFVFLNRGHGAFLKQAKMDFIDEANNEKLSTTSSECRINITSQKASTYAILERLDRYFNRVEDQILPIGKLVKPLPSDEQLQELGRITSTSLKLSGKHEDAMLQVSLFNTLKFRNPNQIQNEGKADTVRRLLTTQPTRGEKESFTFVPSLESTKYLPIEYNRERGSMSWSDKLKQWFRYVTPLDNPGHAATARLGLESPRRYEDFPGKRHNITTATFGHILHSQSFNAKKSIRKMRFDSRILSPVTPHPAALSALKPENDQSPIPKSTIVLKFAPHINEWPKDDKTGPPLVRLSFSPDQESMGDRLKILDSSIFEAVVPRHVDDILLGGHSVDVRITNERRVALDTNQPNLQEFFRVANFDLLGGRLRTPKDVLLSIPETWNERTRQPKTKTPATTDILYDFRGIEIHQTIEIPFRGQTLRYSVIEAGQHGGRRQEISLQADRSHFNALARKRFFECVEDIATGKVWSWDEGFKSVKATQFEDFSFDLIEEKLGDDWSVVDSEVEGQEELIRRSADYKPPVEKKVQKPAAPKPVAEETEERDKSVPPSPTPATEADTEAAMEPTTEPTPEVVPDVISEVAAESTTKGAVKEKGSVADLATPTESYEDFFKRFADRAGDQLDRFKPPKKSKNKKARDEEILDDDDPFKLPPKRSKPVVPLSSAGSNAKPLSDKTTDGYTDTFEKELEDLEYAPQEWDDKNPDDDLEEDLYYGDDLEDVEDNEMSTEEIEAELIKALQLDRYPPPIHPTTTLSSEANDATSDKSGTSRK
ncbi:mitochondrial inner-membrane-bound regulator-domain-containing protein [Thelonectria olida]|uniref:Mitochondrial inner-membrane-bound regulator-domain-containing protein n=1 Tax=Thelonectria olida TaxID=1576542 RepID=A0A9P8W369_9HYPO|nr:mitochondrial inner-membrane-bound regulator-domain-containing protein [Thelonectria olida]